jgi:D-alanyl-D-alanine dipeptidase
MLCRLCDGALLNFGAHFDEMSPVAHTDYFERLFIAGDISSNDERLVNRRLLYWAMRKAGFTNYPYEFWHYDFGNQMYVLSLNKLKATHMESAWYGHVTVPQETHGRSVGIEHIAT